MPPLLTLPDPGTFEKLLTLNLSRNQIDFGGFRRTGAGILKPLAGKMGRNSVFERGLKKPAGGGRRSPEGFLLENGFPPPGQSRLPSVRAFASICYTSPCALLLADSVNLSPCPEH